MSHRRAPLIMERNDRPAQHRQQRQIAPSLQSNEDFPSLCSGPISVRPFTVPSTAQSWATVARFTPPILALPSELLGKIAFHAIPEDASMLNPATLRPKASTINLQLVCRTLRNLVLEQYFRRRPLRVHLFNAELHALLTRDPSRYGGTYPSLHDIDYALREHADRIWWRLSNFQLIPLHRFRRIEIHLVPQLAKVNLPDDKLAAFFYEVPNVDDDEDPEYEDLLSHMKHSLLQDAKHFAKHLDDHFRDCRHGQGQAQIKVSCHESADELPEYDVGQYQLNSLPGACGVNLPRSLKNAFVGPRMPIWEPEEVWDLLRGYSWIWCMTGHGCPARSVFETVQLPSLMIHHYRSTRTPVEWHAYLRQKAVFVWWAGSSCSSCSVSMETLARRELLWRGIDGEHGQQGPTEIVFRSLDRRMIPSVRLLYAEDIEECKSDCAYCTSEEYLVDGKTIECDDAFEVEAAESESMTAINADFEGQLRKMLVGWPLQFALEQQALFLNLADLQTTFLLHKHRKKGDEGPEIAKRMLQNWMAVRGRCNPSQMTSLNPRAYSDGLWQELQQIDLVPEHWKDIGSLQGGMQGAEVRRRL